MQYFVRLPEGCARAPLRLHLRACGLLTPGATTSPLLIRHILASTTRAPPPLYPKHPPSYPLLTTPQPAMCAPLRQQLHFRSRTARPNRSFVSSWPPRVPPTLYALTNLPPPPLRTPLPHGSLQVPPPPLRAPCARACAQPCTERARFRKPPPVHASRIKFRLPHPPTPPFLPPLHLFFSHADCQACQLS
jgi:hypothetical protein